MNFRFSFPIPTALCLIGLLTTTVSAEQPPLPPPVPVATPAQTAPTMPQGPATPPVAPVAQLQKADESFETVLKDAKVIGTGCVTAYSKDDHTLIALPKSILGRLLLWYSEAVKLPPKAVSSGGIITGIGDQSGTTVVTMERQGKRIFIRDHSPGFSKRSGTGKPASPYGETGIGTGIHRSVSEASNGPIIAVLPVLADGPNGEILVDITETFSKDIETLTARAQIMSTGLIPAAVDPSRSYIARVRVFPLDVDIRSHLTFLASDPTNPVAGPQPVSIEIGHSIILLPEKPMQPRLFDDRVGFFKSKYTEYETSSGAVLNSEAVILRRRLEKKNPEAKISDPVQPIVFYIGQGVPERWRPYLKKAVEIWQPALEAAGFSNAIIARDAPTPDEDPTWAAEDVRHNVIRWISQEFANAMGPVIYDPRSGEIISSHILIWPEVINMFERYYYTMAGSLDPDAARLPMSDEKRGELLTYVVAHEVGHTLGLRHNHLASTVYTVAQMRDPAFADIHGPNSSIMAYGRFNQCAQPGDGVTRFMPVIGPYDFFALDWGYGVHGKNRQEEKNVLDALAAASLKKRDLTWAAGEMPDEVETWSLDPRVLMENTGAERIEATRLGVVNILRSLDGLGKAVGDDDQAYRAVYQDMLAHQSALIDSVLKLVGGQYHRATGDQRVQGRFVSPEKQREAVRYLLNEGARSLEPYLRPKILFRAWPMGGVVTLEAMQSDLINKLLAGSRLATLQEQKTVDPKAYGVIELADDMNIALWDDLSTASATQRLLQTAFLDRFNDILHYIPDMKALTTQIGPMIKDGHSMNYIAIKLASGRKTDLVAWAYATLPELRKRLENAKGSSRSDQLHFQAMAKKIDNILSRQDNSASPQPDQAVQPAQG